MLANFSHLYLSMTHEKTTSGSIIYRTLIRFKDIFVLNLQN